MSDAQIESRLQETLAQILPKSVFGVPPGAVSDVAARRLSGGASQETYLISAQVEGAPRRLILRRAPGGQIRNPSTTGTTLATEAIVIRLAGKAGVAAPGVPYVLTDEDGLGPGYFMEHIEGETIARKILRDDVFAEARPKLAYQCGEHAARIHAIPVSDLPGGLSRATAQVQLAQYKELYDAYDYPHPVFEVAFRWLEDRVVDDKDLKLVHGDFRHGNMIIGPDGVRAIIDWELCHLGDPMEDLGWICVNSWRFGHTENPVGGFGRREDMFAGYEAAGGSKVDPERVRFWEVFGTLKWGIMCMTMVNAYKTGVDKSVERATIGRRSSETEIDLLNIIYPK